MVPDGITTDEDAAIVAQACRVLGKLGMTHAALGHVSFRSDGSESALIKAKGPSESGLRFTQPEDIIRIGFDCEKVSGPDGLWSPGESFLHTWVYRLRPEVRCVIHMHPEHAVLLTICEKEIYPIYGAYWPAAMKIAADGLRTYPSSTLINDDVVGRAFAEFFGDSNVVLMHGHGIAVAGTSILDAAVRAVALDQLTTMMYKAYAIGTPKRLPASDVETLARPRDAAEEKGSAVGAAGLLATWRYYCELVGEDSIMRSPR